MAVIASIIVMWIVAALVAGVDSRADRRRELQQIKQDEAERIERLNEAYRIARRAMHGEAMRHSRRGRPAPLRDGRWDVGKAPRHEEV